MFRNDPGLFDIIIGHGGGKMVDDKWVPCKGVEVTVRVEPVIEAYVKSLGDGTTRPLPTSGYLWYPVSPNPIQVYTIGNGELPLPDFDGFGLDQLNKSLVLPSEVPGQQEILNLSFLRFAGISAPEGVTFGIKTVMSETLAVTMKERLGRAVYRMSLEYIVPRRTRLVIYRETKE